MTKLRLDSLNWQGPGQCWYSPNTTDLKAVLLGRF